MAEQKYSSKLGGQGNQDHEQDDLIDDSKALNMQQIQFPEQQEDFQIHQDDDFPMKNPPDEHLLASVLASVFCCWPVGMIAVIKSFEVRNFLSMGDRQQAERSSRDAIKYTIAAIALGIFTFLAVFGLKNEFWPSLHGSEIQDQDNSSTLQCTSKEFWIPVMIKFIVLWPVALFAVFKLLDVYYATEAGDLQRAQKSSRTVIIFVIIALVITVFFMAPNYLPAKSCEQK